MPQLPSAFGAKQHDFKQWQAMASAEGLLINPVNTTAALLARLSPSQKFLNRCEVCSIAFDAHICFKNGSPTAHTCKAHSEGCFCFWDSAASGSYALSVTEDGYILDGHHRWAAAKMMLAEQTLPPQTPVLMERYSAQGSTQATVEGVLEMASKIEKQKPKLVKRTKCSAEDAED